MDGGTSGLIFRRSLRACCGPVRYSSTSPTSRPVCVTTPMPFSGRLTTSTPCRATAPLVHIVDGRFQEKDRRCQSCGHQWTVFEEKETDVNIAISLVEDAVRDRYDTAILLSGDSDLIPAIKAAKRLAAPKRVIVAFPPNRHSAELKLVADGFLHVGINKVRNSQLPEQVVNRAGVTLSRPKHWT
jgi:NYN domain